MDSAQSPEQLDAAGVAGELALLAALAEIVLKGEGEEPVAVEASEGVEEDINLDDR